MRIGRFLMFAALIATASMAFSVSTASAQETEVEILAEPTGQACNPCHVHIEGESHLARLDTGAIVSRCLDEFKARLYNTARPTGDRGEVEWVGANHVLGNCNVTNCTTMNPHWRVLSVGELGGETEHFNVAICLRSTLTGAETECTVEVDVTRGPSPHHYLYTATQNCLPGGVRLELNAQTEERTHTCTGEGETQIELRHHVN